MDQNKNERLVDLASKISRTAALGLAVALVFAAGSLFQFQKWQIQKTYDQVDLSANLIRDLEGKRGAQLIKDRIMRGYHQALHTHLGNVPGAESFLGDLENWVEVENLRVEPVGDGFFVSLLATNGNDLLQQYYGYFQQENGRIEKIIWGGASEGIVESVINGPEPEQMTLSIRNLGPYPWPQQDYWENDHRLERIEHLPPKGSTFTAPGELGIFVLPVAEKVLVKNITRGFPIVLHEE